MQIRQKQKNWWNASFFVTLTRLLSRQFRIFLWRISSCQVSRLSNRICKSNMRNSVPIIIRRRLLDERFCYVSAESLWIKTGNGNVCNVFILNPEYIQANKIFMCSILRRNRWKHHHDVYITLFCKDYFRFPFSVRQYHFRIYINM